MVQEQRKPAQKRKRGSLTKQQIVAAAFAIVDEEGPDACSMRTLGSKLGVTAMAVYGYVSSREALLNEVAARFLEGIDTRSIPGELWEDAFLRTMRALRHACAYRPHFARLLNDSCISEGLEPYMMRLRALYLEQGMPEDIAIQMLSIADSFFAGFCLRSLQRVEKERERERERENERRKNAPTPAAGAGDNARFATESRVPGMLTGKRTVSTRIVHPNERWKRTVQAGYSERAFENGLFVIIEGIRVGASPDPCQWRTPL